MTRPKSHATPPTNPVKFQKGVSGNPGGMTDTQRKIKALCKQDAEIAVKFLTDLVADRSASNRDRTTAAIYIYDQAYGKPRQSLHHTGEMILTHEDAILALAADIDAAGETTTH